MSIELSDYSDIMHTRILPNLQKWILGRIEISPYFNTVPVENYRAESKLEIQIQTQLIESYGPAIAGQILQESGVPDFDKFYIKLLKTAGQITWYQESIDLTSGPELALKGLQNSIESFEKVIALDDEAYLWENGSGCLATAASVSGQVVTFDDVDYLRPGMRLDAVSNTVKVADGVVIAEAGVDIDNKTATFVAGDDVSAVVDDTTFYKTGSYSANFNITPMGLAGHISDSNPPGGSYQEKSRSSYNFMKAVTTYGGTPGTPEAFTDQRFQKIFLRCRKDLAHEIPTYGIMSPGVESEYVAWLKTARAPIERMPSSDGFPESLKYIYNGKVIRLNSYINAPLNTILFINKKTLFKYASKGGFWKPNGNMFVPLPDRIGVKAIYYSYHNTACNMPKGNAAMYDVLENDIY